MIKTTTILRLVSVLLIIYSILNILLGGLMLVELSLSGLLQQGGAMALLALSGFSIISNVLNLLVGVFGMMCAIKPGKAHTFFHLSIVALILSVLNLILTALQGGAMFQSVIITFAIAGCAFLAYSIKVQGLER
ncbi:MULTISPECIES: hypothetical protein [unclassified Adlercreutzia]|uniref:hypothetical protein n=1 Tax=unclassified Adlercreutzia TaxID=2636013 RepID=UPI0013ED909A|nr:MULTISPECIES: hypothetical protein [unclassified Adlercreutzia]